MKHKTFDISNEGRTINGVLTLPENTTNMPLIIMNHGFAGSKDEGQGFVTIANRLAEAGYASARMDFAGCGASVDSFLDFSLSNNESDSNAVLSYVLESESIDQSRLGILGYSMGGRLAIMITDQDNNPYKAMALIAPGAQAMMDFSQMPGFEFEKGKPTMIFFGNKLYIGQNFLDEAISSNEIMKQATPKIDSIVFSGTEDVLVVPEVCQTIADQLESELHTLEGADHGFGFYEPNELEEIEYIADATINFFNEKL